MNKEIEEIKKRLEKIEELIFSKNNFIKKEKKESVREFLLKFNEESNVKNLLAIGYFLENEGKENFSLDDLREKFREAKLKKITNLNDTVNKNSDKAFLKKDGKNGSKQL